ncbi:hypothetical protein [Cupriavidus taiwanensis]|uniref:hypothetical protein n=1 Tax=Cupriavidus taiwanensis TaxID=164546 RepID=UPI000E144A09|nr:hypothetical protein [Cupriavidus taiwanensis]SOY56033.1 conserved hypothetical protein [Cupriavidus taiwanensis]
MSEQRLTFDFVHPQKLSDHWGKVREGLESLLASVECNWLPEDVYHALKTGKSTLHLCSDAGRFLGFVVLTPDTTYDGRVLHIWAAYSTTGRPMTEAFFPFIRQCAEAIDAKRISFASPRAGWGRVAKRLGFRAKDVTYEFEL